MRTVRCGVFETNSSSLHAITICEDWVTNSKEKKELIEKQLRRYKQLDGSYDIVIKCSNYSLEGSCFDSREYCVHHSFTDKATYWLASAIQEFNKSVYNLQEFSHYKEGYKVVYKEVEGFEWKSKHNEFTYAKFLEKIEKYQNHIEHRLKKYLDCEEVNFKFEFLPKTVNNMISHIEYSESTFGTGCYDNSLLVAELRSSFDLFEWLISPFAKIYASTDERDNGDFYADLQQNVLDYKEKRLKKLEEEKDMFILDDGDERDYQIEVQKIKLNPLKIVYPVGG